MTTHHEKALPCEYTALLRCLGKTQMRCSVAIAEQQAEIARLQQQCMRLRAQLVIQTTQQTWQSAPHHASPTPALWQSCIQLLGNMAWRSVARLLHAPERAAAPSRAAPPSAVPPADKRVHTMVAHAAAQAARCQSDCIAHDYRWRAHDACLLQGGACVLGHDGACPATSPAGETAPCHDAATPAASAGLCQP